MRHVCLLSIQSWGALFCKYAQSFLNYRALRLKKIRKYQVDGIVDTQDTAIYLEGRNVTS